MKKANERSASKWLRRAQWKFAGSEVTGMPAAPPKRGCEITRKPVLGDERGDSGEEEDLLTVVNRSIGQTRQ